MVNANADEQPGSVEQADVHSSDPKGDRAQRAGELLGQGARDLGDAASDVKFAVETVGIEVGRELERIGTALVDATEIMASDLVVAGRKLEHDADLAVNAPEVPLKKDDEPVVAATLARVP
jgi:hypothetical protein